MATMTTQIRPLEQRVVLYDVTWETYEQLLAAFGDRPTPRLAYDRGVLEIVSPTPEHEESHLALAAIVAVVAEELGIDFRPVGSTTFRRPASKQGFEADSSFFLGNGPQARRVAPIDPNVGPPPELVIEADFTHQSLNKLPIYATIGVPEVWRYHDGRVAILVLAGDGYQESSASTLLALLTAEELTRLVAANRSQSQLDWLRELRTWVRQRR